MIVGALLNGCLHYHDARSYGKAEAVFVWVKAHFPLVLFVACLIEGGFFICFTQIGAIPDIWAHVYRVSGMLNGDIFVHAVDSQSMLHQGYENVGGSVDWEWIRFSLDYYNGYDPAVVVADTLVIAADGTAEVPYNNTAVNTPVAYLPQLAAFALGDVFGFSPTVTYYFAEVLMLCVYAGCMAAAIGQLDRYRFAMAAIMLFPLLVFRYSFAISADSMAQAFVILFSCLLYRCFVDAPSFAKSVVLMLVGLILSMSKFTYAPLVFLSLVLLVVHWGRMKPGASCAIIVGNLAVAVFLAFWMSAVGWFTSTPSVVDFDSMVAKKEELFHLSGVFDLAQAIVYAVFHGQANLDSAGQGIVISILWVMLLCVLVLLIAAAFGGALGRRELLFWGSAYAVSVAIVLLTYTALYLQYTPSGVEGVCGMQFRYFLPLAPLLLLCALCCVSGLSQAKGVRISSRASKV